MSDVLLICVAEDVGVAEALAEVFDANGFTIEDDPEADATMPSVGAGVLIMSQASINSPSFREAAQHAIGTGKAVVVNLTKGRPPPVVGNSPTFNLWGWNGDTDDPVLNPLARAVERLVGAPVPAAAVQEEEVPVQRTRAAAVNAPTMVAEPEVKKQPPPMPPRTRVRTPADAPPAIPFRVSRPGRMRAILSVLVVGVLASGALAAGVFYVGRNVNLAEPPPSVAQEEAASQQTVAAITSPAIETPTETPLSAAITTTPLETLPPAPVVETPAPQPRGRPPADAPRTASAAPSRVAHAETPRTASATPSPAAHADTPRTTPAVTPRRTPVRRTRTPERTPQPTASWNTALPATPAPTRGPPE